MLTSDSFVQFNKGPERVLVCFVESSLDSHSRRQLTRLSNHRPANPSLRLGYFTLPCFTLQVALSTPQHPITLPPSLATVGMLMIRFRLFF
jgi:hypothetical protein